MEKHASERISILLCQRRRIRCQTRSAWLFQGILKLRKRRPSGPRTVRAIQSSGNARSIVYPWNPASPTRKSFHLQRRWLSKQLLGLLFWWREPYPKQQSEQNAGAPLGSYPRPRKDIRQNQGFYQAKTSCSNQFQRPHDVNETSDGSMHHLLLKGERSRSRAHQREKKHFSL